MIVDISIGTNEFDAMTRVAEAEARIQTQVSGVDPHVAYGSVVDSIINRMATPGKYGSTSVIDVINFPNAYSSVPDGGWTKLPEASLSTKHRVAEYLAGRLLGAPNVIKSANVYYNPDEAQPSWGDLYVNGSEVVIGGNGQSHRFGVIPDEDGILRAVTGRYSLTVSKALAEFFPDGTHVVLGVLRYYLPDGTLVESQIGLNDSGQIVRPEPNPERCFLAGTQISMWDGTRKPIEQIEAGDIVVSYDKDGTLKPGRVKRTMTNRARQILDVHGLMVTPGHATLCGTGRFDGQHVPILDILRSDGALVLEDGSKIRAGTGCRLGTMGDRLVTAIIGEEQLDGLVRITEVGQIRAGTRFIMEDGEGVSVLDLILDGGGHLTEDGMIQTSANGPKMPFRWTFTPSLPKPEDYVLQRSATHLQDIY